MLNPLPDSTSPGYAYQWARPDFYLPERREVIEYAGRLDLPAYRERHAAKLQLYEHNAVRCHEVMPRDLSQPRWGDRLLEAILASSTHTPRIGSGPEALPGAKVADRRVYKYDSPHIPVWQPTSFYGTRTG
jgi:hypothetical protein